MPDVPRITPAPVAAMLIIVGEFDRSLCPGSTSNAFAKPKSRTFTIPSGVIFTFAGFRSRWMIPFSLSCAAASASAIWPAMPSASSTGIGPSLDPIGQGSPGTSSITRSVSPAASSIP